MRTEEVAQMCILLMKISYCFECVKCEAKSEVVLDFIEHNENLSLPH